MKTYVSEIKLNKSDFDRINKLMQVDFNDIDANGELAPFMQKLVDELDARKDTAPYGFEFDFEDGSCITIDIRSGQSNYYDDCVWRKGKEYYVFDCAFEIVEENVFNMDDAKYICKFVITED